MPGATTVSTARRGQADAGSSGLTWVVDPIDGTVNYLYGIPQYAVSIAVVEGEPDPLTWRALAGVVVNPVSGELFSATLGGGAALDGRQIRVNSGVSIDQALVGTGFSYSAQSRAAQGAVLARLISQVRDIRRHGAAALDLCSVACGRLDAYYERGLATVGSRRRCVDRAGGRSIRHRGRRRASFYRFRPSSGC
jgi:myo-inositol-1(or 4)-monophosphatase